ncbi:MAG: hypothetical protein IKG18_18715 [Atopobiaceae bacterium]|nr:hypothetical protein [Atopobiaceae bacterium]MBR3316158.1 hypothetical protein [Atopobiaceae bacterium]
MAGIVIYGSQYGTAREYAEELASRTALEAHAYDVVGSISEYDTIAYIGALYAGGVLGLKKTFSKFSHCEGKTIVIATVGLADPMDMKNVAHIEDGMRRQLSGEVLAHARLFHLRGGIDYTELGFKHRTMMKLLYNKAKNLPEEQKNAEVRAMIETYGKRVSFVDFDSLDPIVAALEGSSVR